MQKTRVLFVYTPSFFGSVWTVCRHIINGLDPDRFDVHVAYNRAADGGLGLAPRPGVTLVPWAFGAAPSGATTRARSGLATRARVARDAAASACALAAYVRRHGIDVVHSNEEGHSAVLSMLVRRLTRTRLVLHYHTVPGIYGRARRAVFRALSWLADWNVGVSEFVARALVAAGGPAGRTGHVVNGVDAARFSPDVDGSAIRREFGVRDDETLVVQSARIWQGKRQEDLVRAVAHLRTRVPNLRCLIIGWEDPRYSGPHGSYSDELRALAAELGVADRVTFADARPEAPQIHAAADIAVLPSVDEPFGLVVAEAMATARPVVAAASGGIPEIVEDGVTGFLVPPCDPAALADRIERLARDPELRRRFGAAARARVLERFTEDTVAAAFGSVYDALARRGAPARAPRPA